MKKWIALVLALILGAVWVCAAADMPAAHAAVVTALWLGTVSSAVAAGKRARPAEAARACRVLVPTRILPALPPSGRRLRCANGLVLPPRAAIGCRAPRGG
ncbi:MAG: hypothetical protein GX580_10590 [Candidatus Hydrogenedens sp.]|nr:hypothetical protein [Candidatus Hydrogenedens sp.]